MDFTGDNYEYERIGDILELKPKVKPRRFGNLDKKFTSEEITTINKITGLTIDKPTTTVYLSKREYSRKYRRERAKASTSTNIDFTKEISNEESLKKKIKGLEGFYKKVCLDRRYRIYDLEKLGWDRKLVKRFLAIKPTKNQLVRVFMGPDLRFTMSTLPGKRRYECIGYLTKGDGWGYLIPLDNETWIRMLMSELKTRNEVMKAIMKKKARQRRKKKMLPYLVAAVN